MRVNCPLTHKDYERTDLNKFHSEDCPYCKKCPKCAKKGIETNMIDLPVNQKLKDCWWCPECQHSIRIQQYL